MLTLVEPFLKHLIDRPHLGCAMLIAACQEKGIKTTLIKGQTRYLKDMFVNDSKELWGLIHDLKENDLKKIGIAEYKKSIQEKGIKQFQDELKILYQNVIIDKNLRHYLNFQMVEKFRELYSIFVKIYSHYLINLNFENLNFIDRYVSEILNNNPRYIGFSLHNFSSFSRIIRKHIKESTGVPIIVGGSLTPFIDLEELDRIFEKQYLDYLVIGCGDHALPSLIEALDNNKEPKGIPNVYYKKEDKIICNDLKIIDDLDSLPYPDYSQFDLDLYLTPKRILPLQAARGCSWGKCTFCDYHRNTFGIYREFSIERIIDVITYLNTTYDCQYFWFHNDDFPPDRAKRFSEAILENKLKELFFYIYARLEDGFNDNKLLSLMHKSGIAQIHWGMESGCQRTLNKMAKGTNLSTMSQIFKKSANNKISNICLAFFGFPGEIKEEAQQTVEFLRKHSDYIDDVGLHTFALSPFSKVANNSKSSVEIKDDGSYSIKNGMIPKEIKIFYEEIMGRIKIGNINIVRDDVRFVDRSEYYCCILYALISRLGLISKRTILRYLKEGKLNNIFPIILGEIKKKDSRIMLCPINSQETPFINKFNPEKEKKLDKLKEEIFILSDGRLSIEDIILIICREFKRGYRKKYIRKKCIDFFLDIFSKDWGLGFAKSWHSL